MMWLKHAGASAVRWKVLGTGEVKVGMKVSIIGFGGFGQNGSRLAVLNGAELYGAEVNEDV